MYMYLFACTRTITSIWFLTRWTLLISGRIDYIIMVLVTMETHMYLSGDFPYSFETTFLYWSFLVDGEFACFQKLLSYLLRLFWFQSIYKQYILLFLQVLLDYRMAGNFRGVLIFVTFVVDLAVTKISTHEN